LQDAAYIEEADTIDCATCDLEFEMAEIINLRMARKAKKRQADEQVAHENRARFGLNKSEKAKQRADTQRAEHRIDGAKRDTPISD
jgi:hypothetical protein